MKLRLALVTAFSVSLLACEEPQQADARKKVQSTIDFVAQGRAELSAGRPEQAVIEFKRAINASPEDVSNTYFWPTPIACRATRRRRRFR